MTAKRFKNQKFSTQMILEKEKTMRNILRNQAIISSTQIKLQNLIWGL